MYRLILYISFNFILRQKIHLLRIVGYVHDVFPHRATTNSVTKLRFCKERKYFVNLIYKYMCMTYARILKFFLRDGVEVL